MSSVTIDAETLASVLGRLTAVASTKEVGFASVKSKLVMFAISEEGSAYHVVPGASVDIETPILFDPSAFASVVKGRGQIKLTFQSTGVSIVGKAYKANLAGMESTIPWTIPIPEDGVEYALSSNVWKFVSAKMNGLSIAEVAGTPTRLMVKGTAKGTFVCSVNDYQMNFTLSKEADNIGEEDMECLIPSAQLQRLLKLPLEGASLIVTPYQLVYKSAGIRARLPLAEDTTMVTADQVYARALEIPKAKGVSVTLPATELSTFLSNAAPFSPPGTVLKLSTKGEKATLEVEHNSGSATTAFKCSAQKDIDISVDFRLIQEITAKAKDTIEFTATDAFLRVTGNKSYYVAALIADRAE